MLYPQRLIDPTPRRGIESIFNVQGDKDADILVLYRLLDDSLEHDRNRVLNRPALQETVLVSRQATQIDTR